MSLTVYRLPQPRVEVAPRNLAQIQTLCALEVSDTTCLPTQPRNAPAHSPQYAQAEIQRTELARFKRLSSQAQKMGYILVPDLAKMRAKSRGTGKRSNENACPAKT